MVKAAIRRGVAFALDMLLVGFLCGFLTYIIPQIYLDIIVFFLLVPPFLLFRDCIFKNASPGKFLLGLRVVDVDGKIPNWKMLVRRNLLMLRTGYKIYGLSRCGVPFSKENKGLSYVAGDTDYFHKWETDVTRTMVVYKKTGKRAVRVKD